jgi:hypothetical protein
MMPILAVRCINEQKENGRGPAMAERKPFLGPIKSNPELKRLIEETKRTPVTEEELQEQRISFAFGNAAANAQNITKDSVRKTAQHIRLLS